MSANILKYHPRSQITDDTVERSLLSEKSRSMRVSDLSSKHSGIHSRCLFVIHHWHWLSAVRVWRLLFCGAYETLA